MFWVFARGWFCYVALSEDMLWKRARRTRDEWEGITAEEALERQIAGRTLHAIQIEMFPDLD